MQTKAIVIISIATVALLSGAGLGTYYAVKNPSKPAARTTDPAKPATPVPAKSSGSASKGSGSGGGGGGSGGSSGGSGGSSGGSSSGGSSGSGGPNAGGPKGALGGPPPNVANGPPAPSPGGAKLTHFISIPLNKNGTLNAAYDSFKNATSAKVQNLNPKCLVSPAKLHFTVAVLSLNSAQDIKNGDAKNCRILTLKPKNPSALDNIFKPLLTELHQKGYLSSASVKTKYAAGQQPVDVSAIIRDHSLVTNFPAVDVQTIELSSMSGNAAANTYFKSDFTIALV